MIELLEEGIKTADPKNAVKDFITYEEEKGCIHFGKELSIKLEQDSKIIVVGAGKASANMAEEVESILFDKISTGIICVPEMEKEITHQLHKMDLVFGGHPLVNEGSITGAKKILDILANMKPNDLVLCLISGGGSALMELPIDDLTKDDLSIIFTKLTKVGATIHELNAVRKHFSQIKGGKLAGKAFPAKVVSLIISDVVGDDIDTIASGPTAPDKTTWKDVDRIIKKYKLENRLSPKVLSLIKKGLDGIIPGTLKKDSNLLQKTWNFVIASNKLSCEAMKSLAEKKGYNCRIISTTITGQAKEIGKELAKIINQEKKNSVIIGGGETTVKIIGRGIGGRNQELVLAASEVLKKEKGIALAAIGTDGKDGPTNVAGGFIDCSILEHVEHKKLKIRDYLRNNDSNSYLKEVNGLLITGHTGTNVMDIFLAVNIEEH